MPYTKALPEWKAAGVKPPQSKIDTGWQVSEKPPAAWWNWFMYTTYYAVQELQQNSVHSEKLASANGVATLGSDGKLTASQLPVIGAPQITDGSIANAELATDVKIGSLASLTTTAKSSVTGAINEVKSILDSHTGDTTRHITGAERTKWDGAQLVKLTQDNGDATQITDFNTATNPGHYYTAGAASNNPTGTGSAVYYALLVMKQGTESTQLAHNKNTGRLYIRYKVYTGSWSSWVEIATTAVATTSANGLMSLSDKNALDGAQKVKLTSDVGDAKVANDFLSISQPGFYKLDGSVANNPQNLSGSVFYSAIAVDTGGEISIFAYDRVGKTAYTTMKSGNTLSPWRKLIDDNALTRLVMGSKNISRTNANFIGKVAGSTTVNPHVAKVAVASSLQSPSNFSVESSQGGYSNLSSIDGGYLAYPTSVNGQIAQALFSFDLVEAVQQSHSIIPGNTLAEKVSWLKVNINKLTINWWGFGSSPFGNKARIDCWGSTDSWINLNQHTENESFVLRYIFDNASDMNFYINSQGFIHFIAYAEPSDGITASVINTDFVSLDVELSTDIKTNLKLQWMNATLQNSWAAFDANQTPRYAIDASGSVRLSGAMKSGTLPAIAFTLPAGFRPTKNTYIMANGINGNVYRLSIDTGGGVYVEQSIGSNGNGFVSLDGLTFPTN